MQGIWRGFWIQLGSPHLTPPQELRSLPLEFVSGVSLGLLFPLLLGAAIEVSSRGSPGFNFCPLQHPEGASETHQFCCSEALGGGQGPTSESTTPWAISPPTSHRLLLLSLTSLQPSHMDLLIILLCSECLSICYVPSIVLDTGDLAVNGPAKFPVFSELPS